MQGPLRSRGLWVGMATVGILVAPWPSRKLSEAFGLEPQGVGHNFPELAMEEATLYEEGTTPTKRPPRLVAYGTDFNGVYTDRAQHPLGWAAGLYRKHLLNSHGGCRAFVGAEDGSAVLHEVPLPRDFPYKSLRVSAHYSSSENPDIEVDSMANIIHIAKASRDGASVIVLDTVGHNLVPALKLQRQSTGRHFARFLFRLAEKTRPARNDCVLKSITLPELQDAPVVGYLAQGTGKHIVVPGAPEAEDRLDAAAFLVAEIPTAMVERLQLQASTPTSTAEGRATNATSPLPALRTTTSKQLKDDQSSSAEVVPPADPRFSIASPLPNKFSDRPDLASRFLFGIAHPASAPPAGLFGQSQRDLVQKMIGDTQTRRVLVGGAIHGEPMTTGKLFHTVPTGPGLAGMALTTADSHPHTHQAVVSGARQTDYSDSPDWVAATTAAGAATLLPRRGNTALSVSSPEYLCTHARVALDYLSESNRDQLKKIYTPSALASMSACPTERKRASDVIEGGPLKPSSGAEATFEKVLS